MCVVWASLLPRTYCHVEQDCGKKTPHTNNHPRLSAKIRVNKIICGICGLKFAGAGDSHFLATDGVGKSYFTGVEHEPLPLVAFSV